MTTINVPLFPLSVIYILSGGMRGAFAVGTGTYLGLHLVGRGGCMNFVSVADILTRRKTL